MEGRVKPKKFLSVIIPAYKEEDKIENDLKRLQHVLEGLRYNYEIIVVVDGEVDNTAKNAKRVRSPKIKIVGYPHRHGKGYAVRFGMANSRGDIIAFIDAGMDIDPSEMATFLEIMEKNNADIVIGSKLHPASQVAYPFWRRIMSSVYRRMIKLFFHLNVTDTQVGLKFFKRKVLEDVLPRILVKAYAFDIEMLAVAYSLGYTKIYEAPVRIDFTGASTITSKNFWRIILHMVWDTVAVFYRLRILHYYDQANNRKWRYDPELNFRVNLG